MTPDILFGSKKGWFTIKMNVCRHCGFKSVTQDGIIRHLNLAHPNSKYVKKASVGGESKL